jgi:hypothetical protein
MLGALGKFNVGPNVSLFYIPNRFFNSHGIGFYSETLSFHSSTVANMDWSRIVNTSLLDPLPFLVGRFLSRYVASTVSLCWDFFSLQSRLKSKPWRKEMYINKVISDPSPYFKCLWGPGIYSKE